MIKTYDILIVGGGAAGFFSAINIAERNKNLSIAILERGKEPLSKVRISGGGRCNVTHHCFDISDLVKFYPRGMKELRGIFSRFGPEDTIAWFQKHGVMLKTENDNRMFPTTDSSQTIIECFLEQIRKHRIELLTSQSLQKISKNNNVWELETQNEKYLCKHTILTTGNNPKIWEMLSGLGHNIISPVPSLFTFNIKDPIIKDLMGLSTTASVKISETKLQETGPLLITHWGLSGPAILKLSAWGARILFEKNYQFIISINWTNQSTTEACFLELQHIKTTEAKKRVYNRKCFDIPNRLWERLVASAHIPESFNWGDLSKKQCWDLAIKLTDCKFHVNGKSTFKDEFVTAGGIDLKEVNLKTMESKKYQNIYFAGEILNIDALTGGFNFQNAWSSGYVLAQNF